MTTLAPSPRAPQADLRAELRGKKLPRWAPGALFVVAAGLGVALDLGLYGTLRVANLAVITGLLFAVLQTLVSFLAEGRRQAIDRFATTCVYSAFGAALVPLALILWYTIQRGLKVLNGTFLGHSMFLIDPDTRGGGAYHAIIGTLEQTVITAALAVPLGILTAIYLVEYGGQTRFGRLVSFFVDVMTGIPSIVAGVFVYAFWLLALGFQKSGFAGSMALAILMLPIVVRGTEEMLKLVPADLREASYALGVPKWRTVLKVVLPTAMPGIITSVMLGVARIMGETAPLILLVGTNAKINFNAFSFSHTTANPQSSLPTFIWEQFGLAAGNVLSAESDRAWAAALTLIAIIMLLTLAARVVARFTRAR